MYLFGSYLFGSYLFSSSKMFISDWRIPAGPHSTEDLLPFNPQTTRLEIKLQKTAPFPDRLYSTYYNVYSLISTYFVHWGCNFTWVNTMHCTKIFFSYFVDQPPKLLEENILGILPKIPEKVKVSLPETNNISNRIF